LTIRITGLSGGWLHPDEAIEFLAVKFILHIVKKDDVRNRGGKEG
jgi:hypothetical protein